MDNFTSRDRADIDHQTRVVELLVLHATAIFGPAESVLPKDYSLRYNGTLPDRSEVVKDFTPECGGKTPRGAAPRGFPDTRGGKTFATEQEGGVMSLP